jgi:DNA-binding IclR family transcriptional regulator
VLSLVDGGSSVDELVDISGLSRSETIRILHGLLKKGVIRSGK